MMEFALPSSLPGDTLKLSGAEVISQASTIPIIRTEALSILSSETATSVISDPSASQFFNLPILQDGALNAIDSQQYILATNSDGNPILLEASQFALLSEQTIPLYDGSNLLQLASQTILDPSLPVDKDAVENLEDATIAVDGASEKQKTAEEEDDILPPDRTGQYVCSFCGIECHFNKQLLRHILKVHGEEKPHQCSQCAASFNKHSNLLLHEATHCASDPTCPQCHRKFSRLASLKAHLMHHEVEENLVCTECGDEFSTQVKLDKHIQDHLTEQTMDQTFICKICSKGFRKLIYLKDHMRIHNRLKASLHRRHYKRNIDRSAFIHKCRFCNKQFQKPSQLVRHNRIHTGERPYKCDICEKAFNQKGALLIHKSKHTGERPYVCDFCPAAFAQKGNLRNHIRRVHTLMPLDSNDGIHKCELCTCAFKKLGSLNAHLSRFHSASSIAFVEEPKTDVVDEDPQTSGVATQLLDLSKEPPPDATPQEPVEKIVESSADILQQALENSGLASADDASKPKTCFLTIADSATGSMRRHLMRNVGGVKYYQCVYCAKEFKKPSDLVRHIRIHTHEKPYKCGSCYRAFSVQSTLNAHMRTHTGTKNYLCSHCKKLFSTSGSLKVHMLLHTGAKPFPCLVCGKTFRTIGHRNSHTSTHNRERSARQTRKSPKILSINDINVANIPLQEPILITDEGYVQSIPKNDVVFSHQIIDTKFPPDRPFNCDICGKGFKKSSHLKQHIRSHTGEKPYKCNLCNRAFVSNGVLKAHARTHTGTKAFSCDVCKATFTTNGSLKRHMCLHSNERPYMCPYCQKTFKTSMNCKKHMNVHRYELAMGMAAGVSVTVISDGIAGELEGAVEEGKEMVATENGVPCIPMEVGNQVLAETITLTQGFDADTETNGAPSVTLSQLSQNLTQEVFHSGAEMSEQTETTPQTEVFEHAQNLFTLSDTDFTGSQLTLQAEETTTGEFVPDIPVKMILNNNILQDKNTIEVSEKRNSCTSETKNVKKRSKNQKKPFKCLRCSKEFKKTSHLKQHILSHTAQKLFSCPVCCDMFSYKRMLQDHIKAVHEGSREFRCSVCSSLFSMKSSLMRHMAIHDVEQPFHCAYCSAKFATRELYKTHLRQQHPNAFSSDDTSITYEDEENTPGVIPADSSTEQAKADSTEPPMQETAVAKDKEKTEYVPRIMHVCPQCSKGFKKPSDLVRHLRIHTGEKPFKCEKCGKAFTVKSTLDTHMKTHTGEKNFSCHVCCSLFATRGSLKVHMRLHTGQRPFQCPHCELMFRTSGHRKSHLSTHFKESGGRGAGRKVRKPKPESHLFELVKGSEEDEDLQEVPVVSITDDPVASGLQASGQPPTLQLQLSNAGGDKTFQIDTTLLQQLQNHFNFNLTVEPPAKPPSDVGAATSQFVSVDAAGNVTINPSMIVHQLGFSLAPQADLAGNNNITLIIPEGGLTAKNEDVISSGNVLFDSRILTMDGVPESQDQDLTDPTKTQDSFLCSLPGMNSLMSENVVYACEICDKTFKTERQLMRHLKTHEIKPKEIYRCDACDKSFKKKNQFSKHLQIHQ